MILLVFLWKGDPFTVKLLITLGIIGQECQFIMLKNKRG